MGLINTQQLVLTSLVLLLLCHPCWGRNRRLQSSTTPTQFDLKLWAPAGPAAAVTAQTCPGAVGRNCTQQCQLRTCQALADIYRASNNISDPWDHEHGWEGTTTQSCQQLLSSPAQDGQPAYCRWHGVSCCSAETAAQGHCYLLNSVTGINAAINNINVSLENPVLLKALKVLHGCGLIMLNMEGNNVAGRLTEEWGQLKHLQYLNLGTCWVHGTIPQSIQQMRNLTFFSIGNNWFSGTLPEWLPDLKHLQVLNLGSQFGGNQGTDKLGLLGSIPARIGEMVTLRELVLEANSLTGKLPDALCHEDSTLLLLNVRGNRLEGSARNVEECSRLVQLDISHNAFTGSLPASNNWFQLATYTASYNRFTGGWPQALVNARILEYLDISHNQLTGLLPPKVTLMSSLKSVKLSNNRFSGTVVEDLYFLPALSVLDLSSNQFVGTTPVAIGLSYSLAELDLSNNTGVTGELPAQLGLLPRLQVVKMLQTDMSCAGIIKPYTVTTNYSCSDPTICKTPQQVGNPSEPIKRCAQDQLLPCFLRFSDYYLPREDNSNMRCKQIIRKTPERARQDCDGSGPGQLAELAGRLPDKGVDRWARWEVDPSYYQYQVCECLLGFSPLWDATGTVLTCVEQQKATQHRSIIIAVAVASAAVLGVALIVWRQYLRTRPRWLRERVLQAKRSKGAPKASKAGDKVLVSILVTDVKDFSDLTRRYPELMNKAMGGHNNIMRKACHAHAGHVMDQEGDSWTIAFHDAEDAVAFGLQVQQALAEKVWSLRLTSSSSSDHTTRARAGSHTTQTSEPSITSSYGLIGPAGPDSGSATPPLVGAGYRAGSATGAPGARPAGPVKSHGSFSAASDDRTSSVVGVHSRNCGFTSAPGQGAEAQAEVQPGDAVVDMGHSRELSAGRHALQIDDTSSHRDSAQQQQQQQQMLLRGALSAQQDSKVSCRSSYSLFKLFSGHSHDGSPFMLQHDSQTTQGTGSVSTGQSLRPTSRLYSAGSALMSRLSRVVRSNLASGMLQPMGSDTQDVQQLRLSVRIGIATGWLPYCTNLESSVVTERAKNYVSDVANGGQVLLDEHTFRLIKHSLSALGTVDDNGYNDKQLQQKLHAKVVARVQRVACAANWCSRGARQDSFTSGSADEVSRDYDTDAIVVHMGGFKAPAPTPHNLPANGQQAQHTSTSDDSTPSAEDEDACEEPPPAGGHANGRNRMARRRAREAVAHGKERSTQLQLYAAAAPKMRRLPQHSGGLQSCLAWCQPVRANPGWQQVQKDYFAAPGARYGDLAPSSQQEAANCRPPLPAISFVFAEVAGAHSLTYKHQKSQLHALNKAIRRCMLQQMAELPGGDGYMCRCHEPDLKYMVAFESPVRAVQWCLLVQDALMYVEWPEYILDLPGFQEEFDPESGQLLFRGPRLRMGMSQGAPSSVLPDHMGHANYTGGAVNRAARFMDAAAQPGQVVCDIGFAQHCFEAWAHPVASPLSGRQSWGSGLDCASPESIPESAEATDWGDPQISLMQLMALRSQSETSGHCRPATGPQGLRSRALHELWYQQQQLKQGQKDLYRKQIQQQQHFVQELPESAARAGQGSGDAGLLVPRSNSGRRASGNAGYTTQASGGSFTRPGAGDNVSTGHFHSRYNPLTMGGAVGGMQTFGSAVGRQHHQHQHHQHQHQHQQLPPGGIGSVPEPVTASFIGTYSFKGSGVFEMVQLQQAALAGRQFPQEPPKGKGMRLSVACGPVQGLPQVHLPVPPSLVLAREAYVAKYRGEDRYSGF